MKIIEALVLGSIQGITEFIPVSSSGHLVLFSKLFGIESGGISFEIFLHAATLLAVVLIYKNEVIRILKKPFSKIGLLIVISTISTGVIYLLFKEVLLDMFETGAYIGYGFLATGIILLLPELNKNAQKTKNTLRKISIVDSVILGIVQGIAIIPGISRSGSTISMAIFRKIDRNTAIKYSFLLSIPAILGALFIDLIDIYKGDTTIDINIIPLILGFIAAFVSGYFAIKFLIKFVIKNGLYPFAYYVIPLGVLVLLDQYIFKIFFKG